MSEFRTLVEFSGRPAVAWELLHDSLSAAIHEFTLKEVSEFLGMHYFTISIIGERFAASWEQQE